MVCQTKSSNLFFLIQLRGTCDQLKSGHMPIVCIVRFFYLAQYFGRERGRRKKCNKKENAQFCFSLADRLRWSVYRVLLQVAHFVIRFLGPFLSSDESNHASNLPVPSLYLHSPLCLHFRLLALLRRPSLWRNQKKNSVPRFGILRQYHAGYHVIYTLPRYYPHGNQAYITSVSIV